MKKNKRLISSLSLLSLISGCHTQETERPDPYEAFNRQVHRFNKVLDTTVLKPTARFYVFGVPNPLRQSINNFFNHLDLIPTLANDLLQGEGKWAIKDSWRFAINSTLGIGGFLDVAKQFSLPLHANDLGLTLAKWGHKNSAYLVLPLLGPSTVRDGFGSLVQLVLWSPLVYVDPTALAYGAASIRAVDLRAQLFPAEQVMNEALDEYSFMRDAYLQHRNYLIFKENYFQSPADIDQESSTTAVQEQGGSDYIDE